MRKIVRYVFDNSGNQISSSAEYLFPKEEATEEYAAAANSYDSVVEVSINEYNGLNQLVNTTNIKDGNRSFASYVYNGDGLRVSKTASGTKYDGSYTYVYSGSTMVGMSENGNVLDAMYIGAFGVAETKYANGSKEYNFANAHGDVTNTVDANGHVLNTFDYDEFGNQTVCEENGESYLEMAHFRYAGEYYDIETGNYYLKARYYNPATGRFTQVDSFLGYDDNVLSLSRYTYCHNNPIMFVDPSGHSEVVHNGLMEDYSNAIWNNYGEIIGYNPYGAGYTDRSDAATSIHGGGEQAHQQIFAIDPMNQADKTVMYSQTTGLATLVTDNSVDSFRETYWSTADDVVTMYNPHAMEEVQVYGYSIEANLEYGWLSPTSQVEIYNSYDGSSTVTWAAQAAPQVQSGNAYTALQIALCEVDEATITRWNVASGLRSIGIDPLSGEYIGGSFVNYLDFVTAYQPYMKTKMSGNAGRVSDSRTRMLTTIFKGLGMNITHNSIYDSWSTIAAVDAIQGKYWEITNSDFYDNLITILISMNGENADEIKSGLATSQAAYRKSLIAGQKKWEEAQRREAERIAAEKARQAAASEERKNNKVIIDAWQWRTFSSNSSTTKGKTNQNGQFWNSAKLYVTSSAKQVIFGNYTDDVTLLGTGGQVALGFTGIDFIADGRDVIYDLQNWEWSWSHAGQTAIDAVGLIPVIGAVKYADEVGTVVKHADEVTATIKSSGKMQTPDQKALRDIAAEAEKSAKRGAPITKEEAKILDEWAEEYNVPQHHQAYDGSGKHFPGGNYSDHTHIYNIHVPYASGGE